MLLTAKEQPAPQTELSAQRELTEAAKAVTRGVAAPETQTGGTGEPETSETPATITPAEKAAPPAASGTIPVEGGETPPRSAAASSPREIQDKIIQRDAEMVSEYVAKEGWRLDQKDTLWTTIRDALLRALNRVLPLRGRLGAAALDARMRALARRAADQLSATPGEGERQSQTDHPPKASDDLQASQRQSTEAGGENQDSSYAEVQRRLVSTYLAREARRLNEKDTLWHRVKDTLRQALSRIGLMSQHYGASALDARMRALARKAGDPLAARSDSGAADQTTRYRDSLGQPQPIREEDLRFSHEKDSGSGAPDKAVMC